MKLSEKATILKRTFHAEVAFKQTYWAASGSRVLISEDGNLIEVFRDSERKFIQKLTPWIPVKKGQK